MILAGPRPRVQISDSCMIFIQHWGFGWSQWSQTQGSEFRTLGYNTAGLDDFNGAKSKGPNFILYDGFRTTLQVWIIFAESRTRVRMCDSWMVFIQQCRTGWFHRSQDQGSEFQTLGWFSYNTASLDDFSGQKTKGPNFDILNGFHTTLQVWMIIAEHTTLHV